MKKQQEAAEKEAQKLIKNFKEIQKKADKKSKKREKDIEQKISKMEVCDSLHLSGCARLLLAQLNLTPVYLLPQINVEDVDGEDVTLSNSAAPIQTTSAMSFSDMVGIESVSNNASVRSSGSSNSGSAGTFAPSKYV